MSDSKSELHLFEAFGIELEYMIVRKDDLSVLPVTDRVIAAECGNFLNEISRGKINWSNELALHVLEFKTNGPVVTFDGLGERFNREISRVNEILSSMNAMLMPSAMHPFMDPVKEIKLWPHEYNPIYETFNRIFSCQGHGWANLQSMHINLPFSGDEEFGRLHAAIRLVLPLIPALAASSPVVEGSVTGILDNRMEFYGSNSSSIPSITGHVVPEPVYTMQEYQDRILQPIYDDLKPFDPEGILQEEWVNARGAIARFERNAIEIRVIDIQECPEADLAVASAIIALVRALCEERFCSWEDQKSADTIMLKKIFRKSVVSAQDSIISEKKFLKLFQIDHDSCTVGEIWRRIIDILYSEQPGLLGPSMESLQRILKKGCLASRIVKDLGHHPDRLHLEGVYRSLCKTLATGN